MAIGQLSRRRMWLMHLTGVTKKIKKQLKHNLLSLVDLKKAKAYLFKIPILVILFRCLKFDLTYFMSLCDKQAIHSLVTNCRIHLSSPRAWDRGRGGPLDDPGAQFSSIIIPKWNIQGILVVWARGNGAPCGASRGGGGPNDHKDGWWSLVGSKPRGASSKWSGERGGGGCSGGKVRRQNNWRRASPQVTYWSDKWSTGWWSSNLNLINNRPSPSFFDVNHMFASTTLLQLLYFLSCFWNKPSFPQYWWRIPKPINNSQSFFFQNLPQLTPKIKL